MWYGFTGALSSIYWRHPSDRLRFYDRLNATAIIVWHHAHVYSSPYTTGVKVIYSLNSLLGILSYVGSRVNYRRPEIAYKYHLFFHVLGNLANVFLYSRYTYK